jgi:hypothetical protein
VATRADEHRDAFLWELGKLSKTHGVYVGGCGCLGSPFLYRPDGRGAAYGLKWDAIKDRYVTEGE